MPPPVFLARPPRDFIPTHEACALLGRCERTLTLWVKKGRLSPPLKIGGVNFWRLSEVRALAGPAGGVAHG